MANKNAGYLVYFSNIWSGNKLESECPVGGAIMSLVETNFCECLWGAGQTILPITVVWWATPSLSHWNVINSVVNGCISAQVKQFEYNCEPSRFSYAQCFNQKYFLKTPQEPFSIHT